MEVIEKRTKNMALHLRITLYIAFAASSSIELCKKIKQKLTQINELPFFGWIEMKFARHLYGPQINSMNLDYKPKMFDDFIW